MIAEAISPTPPKSIAKKAILVVKPKITIKHVNKKIPKRLKNLAEPFFFKTRVLVYSLPSYCFANTSGELDTAIEKLSEIFPRLLQLAAMEKEASMLSDEIEKTRRRVNALEYVKIPQYEETIRYITMKLDEDERGNQTRLMKVKDLMLKEAIEERQEQDRESRAEYDRAHACQ